MISSLSADQKGKHKKKWNCTCMPPDGGILCGQGVADLHADPWLFHIPITSNTQLTSR
jgi:hypothetical protein